MGGSYSRHEQMDAPAGDVRGLGQCRGSKLEPHPCLGRVGRGAALCTRRPHTGWSLDTGPGRRPAQHLRFPLRPLPGFLAALPASARPSAGLSGLALFIQLGQRKQLLRDQTGVAGSQGGNWKLPE